MKEYIVSFCDEFTYPVEAKEELLTAYTNLEKNHIALEKFERDIKLYYQDELVDTGDYSSILSNLDETAEIAGVNKYNIQLLFLICLSKHTREIYEARNISYEIFYDSMSDLKWKLFECHKLHGVWGNFVAFWDLGFFFFKLFALGRLQFELSKFEGTYNKAGHVLNDGDCVINMHIPSCGALLHEDCLASYRKASEFFKDHFKEGPIPFVCYSWLLFPQNKEILPQTSNILKFMDDFDIITSKIDEAGSDLWRIFYKDYEKQPSDLPRDTSLQSAYANWLMQGNKTGTGYGVFFFDGAVIK